MSQAAKKPSHTQTAQKKSDPMLQTAEAVQKAEEKVLKIGRDSVEDMMSAADSFSRASRECADLCCENFSGMVETGSAATRVMQNVSNEILQSCNQNFTDLAELSSEAFACRTLKDITELQSKAVQQLSDNYFSTTNKLYNLMSDGYTEALESFYGNMAWFPKITKAMAA